MHVFFVNSGVCEKMFLFYSVLRLCSPNLPHVFNVDEMAVQVRPRRKGIFFRRQYDTPLFTPPTLKRGGKGRNDSSDVMSMGTFFRRHRYIKKWCWVC